MKQVRNGQQVVPTCPSCGCRLTKESTGFMHFLLDKAYGRDAKGHKCRYVDSIFIIERGVMKLGNGPII